jgi:peroxiredoxin
VKKNLIIGLMAVMIVLGFVSFWGSSFSFAQLFRMGSPLVGESAADFTLKALSGEETSFNSFRHRKKSIVFFWASWCPHCRTALVDVNSRRSSIKSAGIKLAAVNTGENARKVKKYVEDQRIHLEIFLDESQEFAKQYGVVGLPTFVFIDEGGAIRDVRHDLPKDIEAMFK